MLEAGWGKAGAQGVPAPGRLRAQIHTAPCSPQLHQEQTRLSQEPSQGSCSTGCDVVVYSVIRRYRVDLQQ